MGEFMQGVEQKTNPGQILGKLIAFNNEAKFEERRKYWEQLVGAALLKEAGEMPSKNEFGRIMRSGGFGDILIISGLDKVQSSLRQEKTGPLIITDVLEATQNLSREDFQASSDVVQSLRGVLEENRPNAAGVQDNLRPFGKDYSYFSQEAFDPESLQNLPEDQKGKVAAAKQTVATYLALKGADSAATNEVFEAAKGKF